MNKQGPEKKEPSRRLAEINRAITTSLDFDRVLDLIVENSADLVDASISALLLMDKSGLLRIRAAKGLDPAIVSSFSGSMQEDIIQQLHKSLALTNKDTLLSVPIIAKASLSGLLAIVRDHPLNEEEEWQLSALADQAAIALTNAKLYEMELAEASRERDVTLKELQKSNQKISTILESITQPFYSLDPEWRFVDANPQWEKKFGLKREEIIGKVIWDVFPKDNETLFEEFTSAVREMKATHFEVASHRLTGFWFEVHAYPSSAGLNVYLNDITARKQAEVSHRLLAGIVESSDDAIISRDLDGTISSWNKGAERIFGYTADEAVGQPVTMLIPFERFDEEPTILDRIRQGMRVEHYETVRLRKDGTQIYVSLTVSPIKNEAGVIIGASKIARDISERKRKEDQIRFQARLLDAVEEAVIATDLEGKILYWNLFAEWLYGWRAAEAVGANVMDIIPTTSTRAQAADIFGQISQGDSWSGEFICKKKDGTDFPALVTDSPIHDERGALIGIVGVSIDITDRKRAEDERAALLQSEREARGQAEEANRLKDEFLATLSHELRNPLNVILGYAEVLLRSEEAKHSPFVSRAAEILKRNALAQSQLVRDLLDLSRLHMGKLSLNLEALSLTNTINDAVETVRSETAEKEIDVRIDVPEEVVFVDGDPLRMEQVVWNLLNNAVKFTPPGGKVTVKLRDEGGHAVLTVEDTGQGIAPEFLPHVFEMFRQADASTSRRHGGMGIGLALVQELVQLHNGSVSVYSEGAGTGARFVVKLPLSRATNKTNTEGSKIEPEVLSQMRILVVDDSVDTVDMLRHLFEMDGATVRTAGGGAEALEIAEQEKFDVILSDISMPGMDGFELLRRLRTLPHGKDVPVLALTGFGRVEDVERAKAEGFFSHVTKPVDVGAIIEILQKLPVS
ncbi:MAG: PAS domain S-box protein [Acidobacteriota bacterium]